MRVSSQQSHMFMLDRMQQNTVQQNKLMDQMSQGKRVLVPSDDLTASMRLMQLDKEISLARQYESNCNNVSQQLNTAETYLGAASTSLQQIASFVSQANNPVSQEDRETYAASIADEMAAMISALNHKTTQGNYIFSGGNINQPTITVTLGPPDTHADTGNNQQHMVLVAEGLSLPSNVPVMGISTTLDQLAGLLDILRDPNANPVARQNALNTCLSSVEDASTILIQAMGMIGNTQKALDNMRENNQTIQLHAKIAATTLETLDLPAAALQLNELKAAIEASNKVYLSVSKTATLFDLL